MNSGAIPKDILLKNGGGFSTHNGLGIDYGYINENLFSLGNAEVSGSVLAFENIKFKDLEKIWPEIKKINREAKEQIEIESLYSGYLKRQREDILDFKKDEELKIPVSINYTKVGSLSNEIVEKLSKTKPRTIGAASRISGVTPAAIIAILRFVKKKKNKKAA